MANYTTDEYRIEVRMVAENGEVLKRYDALQQTPDRDMAFGYWDLFYDALCDVYEFNLFQ